MFFFTEECLGNEVLDWGCNSERHGQWARICENDQNDVLKGQWDNEPRDERSGETSGKNQNEHDKKRGSGTTAFGSHSR